MLSKIESEFYIKIWLIFDVVFNGICSVFGIVGNLISLVVLRRLKDCKSTVYLLAILAVTDMVFLIYITVSHVIPGACLVAGYPQCYISIFRGFWISWPLGCTSQTAGTLLTVAITCDRYLTVRFPFKAIAWSMQKKIKLVIIGIILAAMLFNIPRFIDKTDAKLQTLSINDIEQPEAEMLNERDKGMALGSSSSSSLSSATVPVSPSSSFRVARMEIEVDDVKLNMTLNIAPDYDLVIKDMRTLQAQEKTTSRHVLMQYVYNVVLCWLFVYFILLIVPFVLNILLIRELRNPS